MKKGEIYSRGIALISTLAFMALVRPDPTPSGVLWSLVAILLYEGIRFGISFAWSEKEEKIEVVETYYTSKDMKRWEETRLAWPIHEEVI